MYTLIHSLPIRRTLSEQMPAVLSALIIAELLYKFHSFTLEALAFLATWYVTDMCISYLSGLVSPHGE